MGTSLFETKPEIGQEIVVKQANDVRLIEDGESPRDEYWVYDERDPAGDIEFHKVWHQQTPNLLFELLQRGGFVDSGPKGWAPIKTATLGKPAIAAYLRLVEGQRNYEIANWLDVSKSTVAQYLSDFAQGKR